MSASLSSKQSRNEKSNVASPNSADPHRLPPPPFTIKELRDAIPPHCFERSLLKSSAYMVADLVGVATLFSIAYYYNEMSGDSTLWKISNFIFWPMYWFAQGAVMTGLWVIAHECGHQAFSKWKIVNDSVGWVLHSLLLVPYHSWRITHGQHHKATAHMEKDQVYVPKTWSQLTRNSDIHHLVTDSPLVNLFQIVVLLTVGWPFYLATNAWSQEHPRRANHFEPESPMFKPEQRWEILVSDFGLVLALALFGWASMTYSFKNFVLFYFVPYLWVNFWLVLITYLQHTDTKLPHYRGSEWNFIRGALSTVDRDYGIFNILHHHIADTHIAHHLFSTMPHYNAQEATEALKKVLGPYYLKDDTHFMVALWRSWNSCHYVDDEGDILYYKTIDPNLMKKVK